MANLPCRTCGIIYFSVILQKPEISAGLMGLLARPITIGADFTNAVFYGRTFSFSNNLKDAYVNQYFVESSTDPVSSLWSSCRLLSLNCNCSKLF